MKVKVGDRVTVKEKFFGRGGKEGTVIAIYGREVSIDFYCDVFGDPAGLPSIEAWKLSELETKE